MAFFYVKLGPRGIVFRAGTLLIGVMGSWVYWRASRRRGMMGLTVQAPGPVVIGGPA